MKIRLEEYRKKRKLSQLQLAEMSGIPQPMISMIESGKVPNPGIVTVSKLACALRCLMDDLIDEGEAKTG